MRVIVRLGLLMVLLALVGVSSAAACDRAGPSLGTLSQQAAVIVVGTIGAPTSDVATVEVDQYLKGGGGEREMTLLNHQIDLAPDCSRSLGVGDRFVEGTRMLLFLEPNSFEHDALWQTSSLAIDEGPAWEIVGDQVSGVDGERSFSAPLTEIISQIAAAVAGSEPPVDPARPLPLATVAPGDPFAPPLPPPGQFPPEPTATPSAVAADSVPNPRIATTLPWALIAIGIVSGGLALWGWARARRAE